MWTVYKIVCSVNERYYIGRTANLEERWKKHKVGLRCGSSNHTCWKMFDDFKKYGLDVFKLEVLEEDLNLDLAKAYEWKYIFDGMQNNDGLIYNVQMPNPLLKDKEARQIVAYIMEYYRNWTS